MGLNSRSKLAMLFTQRGLVENENRRITIALKYLKCTCFGS